MDIKGKIALGGFALFAAGAGAGFLVGRKVTDDEWTAYLDEREQAVMDMNEDKFEFDGDEYTDIQPDWYDSDDAKPVDRTLVNEEKPSLQDLVNNIKEEETGEVPVEFINRRLYKATNRNYVKRTGTYFSVDEILAGWDKDLEPIDLADIFPIKDVERIEAMLQAEDVPAVYIRSNVLETDFEIVKSDESWLESYNELQKDLGREVADEQGYIS